MKIAISNDLFDIANRLKELNEKYKVVFNTDNQKFEIEVDGRTEIILPYDNLDERAIRRAYYTRSENINAVLNDLEKENKQIEIENIKKAQDTVENEFSRITAKLGI